MPTDPPPVGADRRRGASLPGRLAVGLRAHLSTVVRAPTTLALLVVLPPLVVVGYAEAMAAFPAFPFTDALPRTLGRVSGAVFATAFLAGLLGLFQVVSATHVDRRLALCGFDRPTLFLTRLGTVLAVGAVAAGVSLGTLRLGTEPAAPLAAAGALLLAALTYGLLGVLVGSVLPRELEGSLVLVVLADMDTFLSSGLVAVDASVPVPGVLPRLGAEVPLSSLLPLAHAHDLFRAAVIDGTVPGDSLWAGVAYVLVLLVAAGVAYARLTATGGGD